MSRALAILAALWLWPVAAGASPQRSLVIENIAVRGVRVGRRQAMVARTGLQRGMPADEAEIAEARACLLETGLFKHVSPRLVLRDRDRWRLVGGAGLAVLVTLTVNYGLQRSWSAGDPARQPDKARVFDKFRQLARRRDKTDAQAIPDELDQMSLTAPTTALVNLLIFPD